MMILLDTGKKFLPKLLENGKAAPWRELHEQHTAAIMTIGLWGMEVRGIVSLCPLVQSCCAWL